MPIVPAALRAEAGGLLEESEAVVWCDAALQLLWQRLCLKEKQKTNNFMVGEAY